MPITLVMARGVYLDGLMLAEDCTHWQYEFSQRISAPGPDAISGAGP